MTGTSKYNSPILLAGAQRSGTSLLRAIIGSHPDIAIYQWDLPLWTKFYPIYKDKDFANEKNTRKLILEISANKKATLTEIKADIEKIISDVSGLEKPEIADVFAHYLDDYAKQAGRKRFGLKTPYNELYANEILNAYPDAKIVQMVRDPRDVGLSMKNISHTWGQKYGIHEHIIMWEKSVRAGMAAMEKHPDRYYLLRYCDLVTHPEKEIKTVCQFLNLEYKAEMLNMQGQAGWTGTNTSFKEDKKTAKEKFKPGSIGRFKEELPEKEIAIYQYYLKDLLEESGFEIVKTNEKPGYLTKFFHGYTKLRISMRNAVILAIQRSVFYGMMKK